MKPYQLPLTVAACLLGGQAVAGGAAPFYVGGALGASHTNLNGDHMDNHGVCTKAGDYSQTCKIKKRGKAGKIHAGMQITDSLAVEAGYVNLGETANFDYSDPIHVKQKTHGLTLSGVARQRLGQTSPLSVYGKAGLMGWQSQAEVKSTHPSVANQKVKQKGISPVVGVGVQYEINDKVTVQAGWERYFGVGKKKNLLQFDETGDSASLHTLDTDTDMVYVGLNVNF